jgi:hypothetical protein
LHDSGRTNRYGIVEKQQTETGPHQSPLMQQHDRRLDGCAYRKQGTDFGYGCVPAQNTTWRHISQLRTWPISLEISSHMNLQLSRRILPHQVSWQSANCAPNLIIAVLNQNAHPFTFIDESQRRHSVHMRKTIRSHIRRGISAKQRQLNAEARPRALGQKARKLLRRSNEANATSLEKRGREDVGRAGHHQRADESSILAPGDPFGGTLPQNNAVESQRVPLQITGASMDISLSILTQEEKRLALLPLQRQQFNIGNFN